MIGFLSLEDHAKFREQKEGTTHFLSNIRIKIGSLHPQKVGSKLDRSSHPLFERWHRPGFSEVGRKGKQWWVKPTQSWTYDRNRNQGKGSTMKQYFVVEVCRRGIDTASLYISTEAKHDVYIYISRYNDFQDPHKSSQLMSIGHKAQRSLLLIGRASTLPPYIAQRHIWQWHITNKFTIYHTVCKLYDAFSAWKSQQPCEIQRQPTCIQPIWKTKRIIEDLILKNTTFPRLFSS